jgi:threonine dehydratase
MLIAAKIPEQPGSFRRFCNALGRRGITEFNYRFAAGKTAHIFAGIQLSDGRSEREQIFRDLRDGGFHVVDLSDNETAKLHVRHMVGGRSTGLQNERLFRFEFPERPGALLDFLDAISTDWNISLFHYRNHGSDHGRVLAGIDIPENESAELEAHLQKLGYAYWDESDNLAYSMFLA